MKSSCADRKTKAARRYVSPRQGRALTQSERETRALCYLIKTPECPEDLIDQVAREMAALFWNPANLIPVPDRHGDTSANRRLAEAIARKSCRSTKVYDLLGRSQIVDSSCDRHKSKDIPMSIEDHHIIRVNHKLIPFRDTFFVDNVITSGTTIAACRRAIGIGTGLVFADAYHTIANKETAT